MVNKKIALGELLPMVTLNNNKLVLYHKGIYHIDPFLLLLKFLLIAFVINIYQAVIITIPLPPLPPAEAEPPVPSYPPPPPPPPEP